VLEDEADEVPWLTALEVVKLPVVVDRVLAAPTAVRVDVDKVPKPLAEDPAL
jgi:hypothetical protein